MVFVLLREELLEVAVALVVEWVALAPYFCLFAIAMRLPRYLGGLTTPSSPFPDWKLLVFFWPLTFTQLYLTAFWAPLLLIDYQHYLRTIGAGEKAEGSLLRSTSTSGGSNKGTGGGKAAGPGAGGGLKHALASYLYTRYCEHPWVRPQLLLRTQPSPALLRAAAHPDSPAFLRPDLPVRAGPRPSVLHGLPQRQTDQLPVEEEWACLHDLVFRGMFQGSKRVEVRVSVLEGSGALGVRWKDARRCRPEARKLRCEFAHEHVSDRSWHMVLSPKDALTAMAAGWAEAGPDFLNNGVGPVGYVLVYAPRSEEDRAVFLELLHASLCFTGQVPSTPPQHPHYYYHRGAGTSSAASSTTSTANSSAASSPAVLLPPSALNKQPRDTATTEQ